MVEHRHVSSAALAAGFVVFALSACSSIFAKPPPVSLPGLAAKQNWTDEQRRKWYTGSQGSRLIPERWLRALEAPSSTELLLSPAIMRKYNYIDGSYAGSTLPLGFAIDRQDDSNLYRTKLRWFSRQSSREPWVGLNCAACHTAQLEYNGQTWLVDGAPTLADFQAFTAAVNASVNETYSNPHKWDRFAARVLAPAEARDRSSDSPANRGMLRGAVASWLRHENALKQMNATSIDYGYGRLDAVGHILNKTAMLNEAAFQIRGEPDAPVSYPFIWNAPQHDYLQWNGIVQNSKFGTGKNQFDIGALVRNTSEVMGVFADVRVTDKPSPRGYSSSVDVNNLVAMETQLGTLMSPAWPSFFPGIDEGKRRLGERLFKRDCAGCHAPLSRTDLTTPIKAEMTPLFGDLPLGTDPWMACNAYTYEAQGGLLTGDPVRVLAILSDENGKVRYLGAREATAAYLQTQVVGVLLAKKWRIIANALRVWAGFPPVIIVPYEVDERGFGPPQPPQLPKAQRLAKCQADGTMPPSPDVQRLLSYKARPLNGIWATPPYLHNGSVRSLYQLLLKPNERARTFVVGNREFDPKEVGFVDKPGIASRTFSTHDAAGKPIPGNSNEGHFYREYTDPKDRWALVEYMKSL